MSAKNTAFICVFISTLMVLIFYNPLNLTSNKLNTEIIKQLLKDVSDDYFFFFKFNGLTEILKKLFEEMFKYFNQPNIKTTKMHTESRYNFATLLGGAKILEKNTGCFSDKSVLDDNPDNYMINTCSNPTKYIIIRLTEDILINEFSLINKEFYSSNLKIFEVYGSISYPSPEWKLLGKFEAKDLREWQSFQVNATWVRFTKFVFLSYHGNNFYCTLTQIKIYGVTMLVDFRNDFSKNFNKTEFELNKIIKNRTLNLIKEEKADKNKFKINKKYEKNLPEDLIETNVELFFSDNNGTKLFFWNDLLNPIESTTSNVIFSDFIQFNESEKFLNDKCFQKPFFSKYLIATENNKNLKKWSSLQNINQNNEIKISKTHKLLKIKEENTDMGYESIFKTLTKHVKVLEINQMTLQDFITTQERNNIVLIDKWTKMHEKIKLLQNSKNSLKDELQKANDLNKELLHKLDNISGEIKKINFQIELDSKTFIMKVLCISVICCLAFFVLVFCLYKIIEITNYKTYEKLKSHKLEIERSEGSIISDCSPYLNLEKIDKIKKTVKKSSKLKKHTKINNNNNTGKKRNNRRVQRGSSEIFEKTPVNNSNKKNERSLSADKETFSDYVIWGISPYKIKEYFKLKF